MKTAVIVFCRSRVHLLAMESCKNVPSMSLDNDRAAFCNSWRVRYTDADEFSDVSRTGNNVCVCVETGCDSDP